MFNGILVLKNSLGFCHTQNNSVFVRKLIDKLLYFIQLFFYNLHVLT